LMDLALGELGLTREAVYRMTWGDLTRAIYGHRIREDRHWDRTRHIMALIYNTRKGKRQSAKKPSKLMPLAIDRMHKRLEWTEEHTAQFNKALSAWDFDLLKKGTGKPLSKTEAELLSKHKWER